MGMYELASGNSIGRGREYCLEKKVLFCEKQANGEYAGDVQGSAAQPYHVRINLAHPRKSTCDCPFAEGRRVICKHMMAMYFSLLPDEIDRPEREYEEYLEEEKKEQEKHREELTAYVKKLSKKELQERLLQALLEIEELENRSWY